VTDGSEVADLELVAAAAFAEIRAALAVFRPDPGVRKVTAFGSARTPPDHPAYLMTAEFGRRLAAAGFMVSTGAGSGIMSAALEGAGRTKGFGVGIRLPFEQKPNATLLGDPSRILYSLSDGAQDQPSPASSAGNSANSPTRSGETAATGPMPTKRSPAARAHSASVA